MDIKNEIRKLARIEPGPYPFFSMYLDTKWDDEKQRERIRLFTRNNLKKAQDQLGEHPEWREFFVEDQQRIERYVEGVVRHVYEEGVNGIAIFSCSGSGFFSTYPSFVPFENKFCMDTLPMLHPLARFSSQYENTLAVMVETDSARLYALSLSGMIAESSIESYVPGRHDQGGWAQMRYQRHIQYHTDRHHKDVAEQLVQFFDTNKWKRIVLIGQDRTLANFKTFLPERVKQHIADTFSVNFSKNRSALFSQIFERLLEKERQMIQQQIRNLSEQSPLGGTAAMGLASALEALNEGRVKTLYMLTNLSVKGVQCQKCRILLPVSTAACCPLCKGNTRAVDLVEEATRAAFRQDGDVKWIDESEHLRRFEGMAASLRFP